MLTNFSVRERGHSLVWALWSIVLFLLPFNRFSGVRNFFTIALIVTLLALWRETRLSRRCLVHYSLWIGCAIVLWSMIVSTLGPYPEDSWQAMRRDLITQVILFVMPCILIRAQRDVRRPILAMVLGFAAVSLLSSMEIAASGWGTLLSDQIESAPRRHDAFWGGYAASASIYLPLFVGLVLFVPMRRIWRILLVSMIFLVALLTLFYGSRSAVLILLVILMIGLCLARRFRLMLTGAAVAGVLVIGIYSQADLGYLNKYKSLANPQTYVTNQGLGLRLAVWKGVAEVISERPWLGFGYGWKKLAWAINDGGFALRWQNEAPELAQYYLQGAESASYGRVNPHNYPLQVVFEIGLAGLALVCLFWASIVYGCVRLIRNGDAAISQWGRVLLLVFIGYFMSNIANGYWVGGVANLVVSLAGLVVALRTNEEAA